MVWSMQSVVTLTGQSVGPVFPESGRWRNQVNGFGEGEHTFLLGDELNKQHRLYWRDKFIEHRRTLVVSWNGKAVYAGQIVGTPEWDADEKRLTVRHREIRGMFGSRLPFGPEHVGSEGRVPQGESSFWALDKRGILRAVLRRGFESDNAQRVLPIDFGPDFAGTEVRSWPWHEFPTIESMVRSVQDEVGGPDVWFEPTWTPTGLKWLLKLGNPQLSAGTFNYVRGVDETPVVGFKVRRDALKQATNTWGLGHGTGKDTLAAVAVSVQTPDMPVLDRVEPFKDIESSTVLQSLTDESSRAHAAPTQLATYRLQVGPTVDPSLIRPGSVLRVRTPEDEWLDAQVFEGRLASVEGDMGNVLTVGVL